MARYKVTSPVASFTGVAAGVAFANGEATLDTGQRAHARALAYFNRRGYQVTDLDAPADEPEQAEVAPKRPGKSASKAQWVAFAAASGVPQEKADALTQAQLVEQIDDLIAEANKPADETPNGGPQE